MPVDPFPALGKETYGSPKFPSHPCEYMPCSQTPVVFSVLAKAYRELLPSALTHGVGVHALPARFSLRTTTFKYFGAPSHGLHPRYTRLRTPCYQDARGFTTGLLATLWPGGN